MVRVWWNRLWMTAVVLLLAVAGALAANADKAMADTESRRRAAENGLREIKAKSADALDETRRAYATAAAGQNAWLDQVCKALEETTPGADVSPAAQTAASTLVDWVAVRNRALAAPVMTIEVADSVKKSIVRDLLDIANATWKSARGDDAQRRSKTVASLRERLRWKPWEDLQ